MQLHIERSFEPQGINAMPAFKLECWIEVPATERHRIAQHIASWQRYGHKGILAADLDRLLDGPFREWFDNVRDANARADALKYGYKDFVAYLAEVEAFRGSETIDGVQPEAGPSTPLTCRSIAPPFEGQGD